MGLEGSAGGWQPDVNPTPDTPRAGRAPALGGDYVSGYTSVEGLFTYLAELGAPEQVVRQIESTRALDGRQSAQWPDFDATWSYDSEDGLEIQIRYVG